MNGNSVPRTRTFSRGLYHQWLNEPRSTIRHHKNDGWYLLNDRFPQKRKFIFKNMQPSGSLSKILEKYGLRITPFTPLLIPPTPLDLSW